MDTGGRSGAGLAYASVGSRLAPAVCPRLIGAGLFRSHARPRVAGSDFHECRE